MCQIVTFKSDQYHSGLTYVFNFWYSGTQVLSSERQSARMSEIINGRLGLYGVNIQSVTTRWHWALTDWICFADAAGHCTCKPRKTLVKNVLPIEGKGGSEPSDYAVKVNKFVVCFSGERQRDVLSHVRNTPQHGCVRRLFTSTERRL